VIVADAERDVVLVNPAARALLDGNVVRERERIIRSYSAPVVTQNAEQPLGTVTVFRDATREQEVDRLKSEFLTVVSHELQTPLTAIKGALELVLDDDTGQLSRVQRRFLDTIERNSTRLIGLVGDLLDMSRLEAGRVELIPRPLDTPSVVRAVVAALANLFDARNIVVDVEVAESTPPILGDRRRVEQILTNLLANAAKYTPPGGKVQVSAAGTETHVTLAVTDSGPGVPEFERDFVFDKFYRGPEAVRRGDAGSGLGLAIVKSLVELHGGDVCLESPHNGVGGHGARVVVNLPRATEEE
jgi:signal transduction histidine kinase